MSNGRRGCFRRQFCQSVGGCAGKKLLFLDLKVDLSGCVADRVDLFAAKFLFFAALFGSLRAFFTFKANFVGLAFLFGALAGHSRRAGKRDRGGPDRW